MEFLRGQPAAFIEQTPAYPSNGTEKQSARRLQNLCKYLVMSGCFRLVHLFEQASAHTQMKKYKLARKTCSLKPTPARYPSKAEFLVVGFSWIKPLKNKFFLAGSLRDICWYIQIDWDWDEGNPTFPKIVNRDSRFWWNSSLVVMSALCVAISAWRVWSEVCIVSILNNIFASPRCMYNRRSFIDSSCSSVDILDAGTDRDAVEFRDSWFPNFCWIGVSIWKIPGNLGIPNSNMEEFLAS